MNQKGLLSQYLEFHEKPFTICKILLDLISIAFVVIHFVIWIYYVPDSGCTSRKASNFVILGGIAFFMALMGLGWLSIRGARASKLYKIFSPFQILVVLVFIVEFLKNCS